MLTSSHPLARRFERGDADTVEFTFGIFPIVMMMLLIAAVALIRPAQLPAWIAARECARMGTTTLNSTLGESQAEFAGYESLKRMPLANRQSVSVNATYNPEGGDPRQGTVSCTVSYVIPVSGLPMVGSLFGDVSMDATVAMKIDTYKSKWQ
jgi:hypothetical protein